MRKKESGNCFEYDGVELGVFHNKNYPDKYKCAKRQIILPWAENYFCYKKYTVKFQFFLSDLLKYSLGFGKDQETTLLSLDKNTFNYYIEATYLCDINNSAHEMFIYGRELEGVPVGDLISELFCVVLIHKNRVVVKHYPTNSLIAKKI